MTLMVSLAASGVASIVAMVYVGRPISYHRHIEEGMALWAASPYLVALLVLSSIETIGFAALGGVLALSIGPVLIFNAQSWFEIDTRYNPIFMATPLLQVACFLPFGLLARRRKVPPTPSPRGRTRG